MFDDHAVVPAAEVHQDALPPIVGACRKHADRTVKFVSQSDKRLLCTRCVKDEPANSVFNKMCEQELYPNLLSQFEQAKKSVEALSCNIPGLFEELDRLSIQIAENAAEMVRQAKDFYEQVCLAMLMLPTLPIALFLFLCLCLPLPVCTSLRLPNFLRSSILFHLTLFLPLFYFLAMLHWLAHAQGQGSLRSASE